MGGRGISSGLRGPRPDTDTSTPREPERSRAEYKEFPDTPRTGYRYHGDGKEAEEWFAAHSNAKEITEAIIAAGDTDAWADYWVPGHFMLGQQYDGWDNMSPRDRRLTQTYDEYLDRAEVRKALTVRRLSTPQMLGLPKYGAPTLEQLQALEGSIVETKGHMSTAAAAEGLTISGTTDPTRAGKPIEYKYNIPAGAKGVGMWICDSRINPHFDVDQREFMINRNTQWRVGKATYDSKRGVFVVEMDYDGRAPHDYGTTGRVRRRRA